MGRDLSRWIYEICMKYESGRESFIYNDGKVSGMSDWSRFGTYAPIYVPIYIYDAKHLVRQDELLGMSPC